MLRAKRPVVATFLAVVLSMVSWSPAAYAVEDAFASSRPREAAMLGDVFFARPVLLVSTVLGSLAWGISLPFSLLGGNAAESAEVLVLSPGRNTFFRCLGCTPAQHQQLKDERRDAKQRQ